MLEKVRHSKQTVGCVKAQRCRRAKVSTEVKHLSTARISKCEKEESKEMSRGQATKGCVCPATQTAYRDFIQEIMGNH